MSQLLEPEVDRVYAVCLRMVGNAADARDLSQDALVKAIKGIEGFDGRASLSTWLTRIAMNACLSWLRGRRLRAHASLDGSQTSQKPDERASGVRLVADEGEPAAGSGVELEETGSAVARGLRAISVEHRAILVLRDVRGLDYEQIALVLDLTVGTVKSRLFRARAALRKELEADGLHDG
ncbi:MAG: RNA polymerase sigma factor [Planctomycetota bacterium]